MAGIPLPPAVTLINVHTHIPITADKLPPKANKSGAIYVVSNTDGTPLGLAISDDDLNIKFYAHMPNADVEGYITVEERQRLGKLELMQRVNFERTLSGVV